MFKMNLLLKKRYVLALAVIMLLAVIFVGCNPKRNPDIAVSYGDIYVSNNSITPYSSSELIVELPAGVSPYYTTSSNIIGSSAKIYDGAYIAGYNLLTCMKKTGDTVSYGVYLLDDKKFAGEGVVYTDISVTFGYIVCADIHGKIYVFDHLGNEIITAADGYTLPSGTKTTQYLIPISEDYFALLYSGKIYKILDKNGNEIKKSDGNSWTISSDFYGNSSISTFGLKAVDDYIISTVYSGTTALSVNEVSVYSVAERAKIYDVFDNYGDYASAKVRAAFYLGDGKMYCYQSTKSDADAYTYYYADSEGTKQYYKISVWYYDLAASIKRDMAPDTVYSTIINKYYSADTPLAIESYLKDGYSYVSAAYKRAADKSVSAEQYIIDSDLNTYVSMLSHEGISTVYDKNSEGYRDVLLTFVGNIGFSTDSTGDILLYDDGGNTILRIDGVFSNVFYNNGIVTALQTFYDSEGKESGKYYAAFNLDGTPVFDAESQGYTEFSAFVGGYALAKDSDNNVFIVDKYGIESAVTGSILNSNKKIIYKTGVYSTKGTIDGVSGIGLKSYSGAVIFDNVYYQTYLQKSGTNTLYCYTLSAKTDGVWRIYKIN